SPWLTPVQSCRSKRTCWLQKSDPASRLPEALLSDRSRPSRLAILSQQARAEAPQLYSGVQPRRVISSVQQSARPRGRLGSNRQARALSMEYESGSEAERYID